MKNELYIGFDVYKDSITVAVAQGGRGGEVRLNGTTSNDLQAIEKLLTRLRKAHGGNPCSHIRRRRSPAGNGRRRPSAALRGCGALAFGGRGGAESFGNPYHLVALLPSGCGLRLSEYLELRVQCFDSKQTQVLPESIVKVQSFAVTPLQPEWKRVVRCHQLNPRILVLAPPKPSWFEWEMGPLACSLTGELQVVGSWDDKKSEPLARKVRREGDIADGVRRLPTAGVMEERAIVRKAKT